MDENLMEYGRVAALRIRAGKQNWSDAEALAEAYERITRRYPVGRSERERLATIIALTAGPAPGVPPSPGEIATAILEAGYTSRDQLMCMAHEDDCPLGPDAHYFVPPLGDGLCCCRQPWEARRRPDKWPGQGVTTFCGAPSGENGGLLCAYPPGHGPGHSWERVPSAARQVDWSFNYASETYGQDG